MEENQQEKEEEPFEIPLSHKEITQIMEGSVIHMDITNHKIKRKQRVVLSLDKYRFFKEQK